MQHKKGAKDNPCTVGTCQPVGLSHVQPGWQPIRVSCAM
jgi:hypothetical protein